MRLPDLYRRTFHFLKFYRSKIYRHCSLLIHLFKFLLEDVADRDGSAGEIHHEAPVAAHPHDIAVQSFKDAGEDSDMPVSLEVSDGIIQLLYPFGLLQGEAHEGLHLTVRYHSRPPGGLVINQVIHREVEFQKVLEGLCRALQKNITQRSNFFHLPHSLPLFLHSHRFVDEINGDRGRSPVFLRVPLCHHVQFRWEFGYFGWLAVDKSPRM